MRVLIVEDDPYILETLAPIVESFGYTPFVASDVDTAIRMMVQLNPQLILLDLLMNGRIAVALIDAVPRLMGSFEPPRIIVFSGMVGAGEIAKNRNLRFLAKPFDLEALREIMEDELKEAGPFNGQLATQLGDSLKRR